MRLSTTIIIGTLALGASLTSGCKHGDHGDAKSPAEAAAALNSPDWERRRHAADELFDTVKGPEGPPPIEAVQALLAAVQKEQEPHVVGALLIALGASGVPEARSFIDPRIADPTEDMRRWSTRALKYWLVRNHLLAKGAELPPPPGPLYGPPPQLPPDVPGSHPSVGGAAAPAGPPGLGAPPPAPGAPQSPGPGPGGSI